MATSSRAMLSCPRCAARSIKANDQGAWCIAFPCRWSVKWAWLTQALTVARELGRG